MSNENLLEKLASLEHEQWMEWSKNIARNCKISDDRRKRWESLWVSYSELSEEMKELDRKYARKNLELFQQTIKQKDEMIDKLFRCVDDSLAIAAHANPDTYNNSEALRMCVKLQLNTLKEIEEMKQKDK